MENNSIMQILALAMEREDGGHKFYLDAAGKTSDAKGKKMFQWLAEEERRHYNKLSLQHKELAEGRRWRKAETAQPPLTVRDFPQIPEAVGKVGADASELDALHIGIKAEKESIGLYNKAAQETTDPEGKAMFVRLVGEEHGHLDLLEAEHEWLRKSREYFTLHRFSLPR